MSFIDNAALLPTTKVDLNPVPAGQEQNYLSAGDANLLRQAALDLRAYVLGTVTSDLVLKSVAQTITGQKTFAVTGSNTFLKIDATGANNNTLAIYRNNNTAGPAWDVGTFFNSQGAYYSNSWMVLSGNMPGSPGADGIYVPIHPTSDSFNLGVFGDVSGPATVTRCASGGYPLLCMDHIGNYVFSVEDGPIIKFGAGNRAAMDCSIYRTGVALLRTDSSLTVDGALNVTGILTPSLQLALQAGAAFAGVGINNSLQWNTNGGSKIFMITSRNTDGAQCILLQQGAAGAFDEIQFGGSAGGVTPAGGLRITTPKLGFYAANPVSLQTGVAVTAAGIHAALVNLGLITA